MAIGSWFDVDKEGLAKLLAKHGKGYIVAELLQNAWDEDATKVDVALVPVEDEPELYRLTVRDNDPDGFVDLRHAYTLFAESEKKADAERRGRFNLGEKLVLAVAEKAVIETTTGTVVFNEEGRVVVPGKRMRHGSTVTLLLRLSSLEVKEITSYAFTLIPPAGITTTVQGVKLLRPEPVAEFEATLPTEIADGEGRLRRTNRKAKIALFPVTDPANHKATIYEMGIPVVATGDLWHVDVGQKVPMGFNRDAVTPSYLRALRVAVLNHAYKRLPAEESAADWVKEAMGDPNALPDAVEHVLTLRFGVKRVAFDPTDLEANRRAAAEGYTVIPGRALSKEEWANAKAVGVKAAGKVTPTPSLAIKLALEGKGNDMARDQWTQAMAAVEVYTKRVAKRLINRDITVEFFNAMQAGYLAAYDAGTGLLVYNVGRLGYAWFNEQVQALPDAEALNALIIHELAHDLSGNHLSSEYYEACCKLGHRLAMLYLNEPHLISGIYSETGLVYGALARQLEQDALVARGEVPA